MKRYSELTKKEIQHLKDIGEINGCGGKGGWLKIPNFLFKAKCDQHDFYYLTKNNEIDRYNADLQFYLMMLQDAHNSNWYWFYRFWAYLYFRAVRTFGYKYFNYNENKIETFKDLEDTLKKRQSPR